MRIVYPVDSKEGYPDEDNPRGPRDFLKRVRLKRTFNMIPSYKFDSILDFGCGDGAFTRQLLGLGAKVIGVDKSTTAIPLAREIAPGATIINGDIRNINFNEGMFDLIVCLEVLHFPEPNQREEILDKFHFGSRREVISFVRYYCQRGPALLGMDFTG